MRIYNEDFTHCVAAPHSDKLFRAAYGHVSYDNGIGEPMGGATVTNVTEAEALIIIKLLKS